MILTLEATGAQAAALGEHSRAVFSTNGGTLGRAKTNDWVLPHPKVSSRHAVITYLDAVFYIEDTSTNGICINSPGNRLVTGRRYALQSGDRILIDPFEIAVSVSAGEATAPRSDERRGIRSADPLIADPDAEDPFAAGPPLIARRIPPVGDRSTPEPVPNEEVDPLRLLGGEAKRTPARQAPTAEDLDHRPIISGHYQPPAVVTPPPVSPTPARAPEPFLIPADYDPLRDDFIEVPELPRAAGLARPVPVDAEAEPPQPAPLVRATPPPQPEAAPPVAQPPDSGTALSRDEGEPAARHQQQATSDVVALLEAAGMENVHPTPELARSIGQIFRVVVSGMMDVLRSRQQVKDEFRMRMTQFRPTDNNPLKFSANADDALHNLLVKRNPAYLGPVEAFEDAFEDLRNHQLATLAGMRVAFESMLAEFDPDRLEKDFNRQLKRVPLLRAIARLRYWDLYRDRREEIVKDPETSFKRLFGEQFGRAYEEQLNRLKAESRARAAAGKRSDAEPSGSR